VGNVMEFLGQVQPRPQIFVPFAAHPSQLMRFIVRTRTDPLSLSDSLRHAVWAVDPDQAVTEIRTMDRVIRDSGAGDDAMAQTMGADLRTGSSCPYGVCRVLFARAPRHARRSDGRSQVRVKEGRKCNRSIGCTRFRCGYGRCFAGGRRTRNWTTSCATTLKEKSKNTWRKG